MTRREFVQDAATAMTAMTAVTAAVVPWHRVDGAPNAPRPTPKSEPASTAEWMSGIVSEEFSVKVQQRMIVSRLLSPPRERLAAKPLLLVNIGGVREDSLTVSPYNLAVKRFLARGHRALGFDLPNHGPRVDTHGEGIAGWRNAWVAGEDRFAQFVEEASAALDRCIELGVAEPGRVVVYGISRGGYMAVRLLAADSRVASAAAIAPVTDWRDLTEFSADRGRDDVAVLRLSRYASAIAGRRVFVVIGNSDKRVSTVSCCRFIAELMDANLRQGHDGSQVEFHCSAMAETGHVVDDSWRGLGADFLLKTP